MLKDDYDEYKKILDSHDPKRIKIVDTDLENEPILPTSTDPVSDTTVTHQNDSIDHSTITNVLPRPQVTVPLINDASVCFFNSVVQVFYSLIPFRTRIYSNLVDNHVVRNMRQLFREIESSPSYNIHTSPIIRNLLIPDYVYGEQIDALEVVSFLIQNSMELSQTTNQMNQLIDMPDYAFFKITELQSIMCANCNKESSFNVEVPLISLNVNAGQSQSIN